MDRREDLRAVQRLAELEARARARVDVREATADDVEDLAIGGRAPRRDAEGQQLARDPREAEVDRVPLALDAEERAQGVGEPAHVLARDPLGVASRRQAHALRRLHEGRRPLSSPRPRPRPRRRGRVAFERAHRVAQRRVERLGLEAEALLQGAVARDHRVDEALDQRGHQRLRRAGDEADPQPREARRDQRDRDHRPAQTHRLRRALHQRLVRDHVGPADVEGAVDVVATEAGGDRRDDVLEGDRLGARARPRRTHHHREPSHEALEDDEGGAAAADDEPRAQGGHRDPVRREGRLGLEAALEVARQARAVRSIARDDAAEVDDLLHAGAGGRAGEVVGADEVEVGEAPLREALGREHRVDEVDGAIDPRERALGLAEGEEISGAPRRVAAGRRAFAAREADRVVALAQRLADGGADVARGARDRDDLAPGRAAAGPLRARSALASARRIHRSVL